MLVARNHSTLDHTATMGIALRRVALRLAAIIEAARSARRNRLAEKHLETLDARMLADIGITRADIADVVRDGRLKVDITGTAGIMPSDRGALERAQERIA